MEPQWKSATHCHSWLHYSITVYPQKALKSNQVQPMVLSTSYFLFLVSQHESLTNQLVASYLLICQFVVPCTIGRYCFKRDIKYKWPCQDESQYTLFKGEKDITVALCVGWMDQAKTLWMIQVREARMEFIAGVTARDTSWNRNAPLIPLIMCLKPV